MPLYHYRAYTAGGQMVADKIAADTQPEAVRQLLAEGLTPFEIGPSSLPGGPVNRQGRLKTGRRLSDFCRNLSAMLAAGLPLDEALRLLSEDDGDRPTARLAAELRGHVMEGRSLSYAFAALRQPPPDYVIGMLRAGEEGGSVVPVLRRLDNTFDSQARLADTVRGALTYPVILLVTSLIAVLVILLVVAPALEPVLRMSGEGSPPAAVALIHASRFVRDWWPALTLTPLVFLLGGLIWLRSESGRTAIDSFVLRLPLMGSLVRDMESARCLSSLSALLENGMSLVPAMELAAQGSGNAAIRQALLRISGQVRSGVKLSDALQSDGTLPATSAQLAVVAEKSGSMAEQMGQTALILEERSKRKIAQLTAMAGPALTLILGVLIGGIVLTLLSAIMSINDLAL